MKTVVFIASLAPCVIEQKIGCSERISNGVFLQNFSFLCVLSLLLKVKVQFRGFSKIKNMLFCTFFLKHSGPFFLYLLIYAVRTYELYVKNVAQKRKPEGKEKYAPPHPHLMLPAQRENRAYPQKGFMYAPFCPCITLEGWVQRRRTARELTCTVFFRDKVNGIVRQVSQKRDYR